jgi:hypothetical protein
MHTMQKSRTLITSIGFACAITASHIAGASELPAAAPSNLDSYNVVWDSPSKDVSGTMPLGNGDIAVNAWVEADGDLLLLIGKSDSWDENSNNLKLGRVRIKFTPNPFVKGAPFRQMLTLRSGQIDVVAGGEGAKTSCRIWVDANQPVIRVESASDQPVTQEVVLETWRTKEVPVTTQVSDLFKNLTGKDPYPTVTYPDVILPPQNDSIVWYHHNRKLANDPYEINMKLQGMAEFAAKTPHPLLDRVFGAAITGGGLVTAGPQSLRSRQPARRHIVSIHPLTLHPSSPTDWQKQLAANIKQVDAKPLNQAYAAHRAWWETFWKRSWIEITDPKALPSSPDKANAADLSRAYQLSRFMNACASRGAQPMKFNGSLFTVGTPADPDFRRWGGPGFWFQNGRLLYWPMLAAGDYDLMAPWFRMYHDTLPFAVARCQKWFKHDGALFGETITFWGSEVSGHYGWTPFEQRKTPHCECSYLTYYWQNGLENTAMMLDCYEHTGDAGFLKNNLLPHATEVTKFYDLHYQRDQQGKIHFAPAASLETWHSATNPLPEIAALKYLMPRLLALPVTSTTAEQRTRWQRLLDESPALPVGQKNGKKVLLPAETYSREANGENPELYAVFPYRLFGAGKPDLDLARNTYEARKNRQTFCWCQNDTQAALLGLADKARNMVAKRGSASGHQGSRFPTFWRANNDWVPDVDSGGNLQLTLQFMLMQTDGDTIRLLPAWPNDWDVNFKLHAPKQTTVECVFRDGKVVKLKVTPESRGKDVVICQAPSERKIIANSDASSANTTHPGRFAIDEDSDTFWHSEWVGDIKQYPHELRLELAKPMKISGIQLLPRQDSTNGWVKEVEILISANNTNWTSVAKATLTNDSQWKEISFPAVEAEFIKLLMLTPQKPGVTFASLAEIVPVIVP